MSGTTRCTYAEALRRALHDALAADDRVILLGEDIGAAGGPFGITRGLIDSFGAARVRDFPISEAAMLGTALGAALGGYRPVAEIMFMDFVTLGMDAIVNQAAKTFFMSGGQRSAPLVVRMAHGAGLNAGAQHSQCLEAWFAHMPGLVVVCPATIADAYGLLRAAIDCPDPVVFVEHKALYGRQGELAATPDAVEIGRARIARPGRDVTVVTYGATLYDALGAAEVLAARGIEVEILDLRSLQPWDEAAVRASLARTRRLVVAHEAATAFGVGAEIAARMAEVAFDDLVAPIVRVGAPFVPVPSAPALEAAHRVGAVELIAAVERVLR